MRVEWKIINSLTRKMSRYFIYWVHPIFTATVGSFRKLILIQFHTT